MSQGIGSGVGQSAQRLRIRRCALALAVGAPLFTGGILHGGVTHTWDLALTGTQQWHTLTNWTGDSDAPGDSASSTNDDVAVFSIAGTTTIGMDFVTLGTPYYLGEIRHSTGQRTIGSSTATPGQLVFNTVAGSGIFVNNTSSSNTFTLAPTVTGGTGAMGITLANSGTFNVTNANANINITAIISESGGARSITKSGAGTLSLSGQNTFSGGLTINAGGGTVTMLANSTGAPGSVTSGPIGTGILTMNGGAVRGTIGQVISNDVVVNANFAIGNLNLAGPMSLGASTRTITTAFPGNGGTLSGVISGDPGVGLIATGVNFFTISGTSNTFDGGFTLNGGTLQLTGDATAAAASTLGPGALTLNAGGIRSNNSSVRSVTNNLVIGGNIEVTGISFDGSTFDLGSTARTISAVGNGNSISAQIINTSGGLTKASTGALALTNVTNSYVGGTTLSGGTLIITNNGQLGATSGALRLLGGTLEAAGSSVIALNRPVTLGTATIHLTNSSTGGLDLLGVVSGTAVISQTGNGTVTLSNTNGFSGPWNIFGGTLALAASNAFGIGTVNLADPGTAFFLNGNSESLAAVVGAGAIQLGSGASLSVNPTSSGAVFNGSVGGNGSITKLGGNGWTLGGTVGSNIGIAINAGFVQFNSTASVPSGAASIQLNSGTATAVAAFSNPNQSNFISRIDPAATAGRIVTTTTVSSPWDLTHFSPASNVVIGAFGSDVFYDASSLTPQGSTYRFGNSGTLVVSNSVLVDGGGPRGVQVGIGLSLGDAARIYLLGNNTYTGSTTIEQGFLFVGAPLQNAGTPSPLGAGGAITIGGTPSLANLTVLVSGATDRAVSVGSTASIEIADSRNLTLTSGLSGSAALNKYGRGVLTLSGPASYTGTTSIRDGVLSISDATNINAGTVFFSGGSSSGETLRVTNSSTIPNNLVIDLTSVTNNNRYVALDVSASNTATFSGNISNTSNSANTGGLAKLGGGAAVSTAGNSMLGGVAVFQGKLALGGADGAMTLATGSNSFLVSGLVVDRNATFSLDNTATNNNSRTPSSWNVNLNGGEFELRGNPSINSSATIGSLFAGTHGAITVTPGSSSTAAQLNIGSMSTVASPYGALLVRGDNLGAAAPGTAGVASVVPTNWVFSGSSGALGTPTVSLLYHVIADASSAGGGAGFALVDPIRGVRPLDAGEYTTLITPGQVIRSNFKSSASTPTIDRTTFVNSLYMTNGNTVDSNSLLVPMAASVFQEPGRGTLNGGYLASPNGSDLSIWTTGTLVANAAVHSSTTILKAGGGALELNGPFVAGGAFVTFSGGTVDFASTATISHSPRFSLTNTYLDLSGADRQIGGLSGALANGLTLGGATVHLGSNALTIGRGVTNQIFDGVIIGSGSLTMVNHTAASNRQTLTNTSSYTGSTNVLSGVLQLGGPNGALPATSAINIAGGVLSLNNQDDSNEFSFSNDNRLPNSASINISAGTLELRGNTSSLVREDVGPITISGAATIELRDNGRAVRLDADALTRSQRGTLVVTEAAPSVLGKRPGLRGVNIVLDAPPTLVGGGGAAGTDTVSIIPWATSVDTATGQSFLTYEADYGLRRLSESEYRAPTMSNTSANIRINGEFILDGTTVSANSFLFAASPTVPFGTATFAPSSGAIISRNAFLGADVALDFGNTEGIIHGDGQIDSPIYGSQGVTLASGFFTLPSGGNFQTTGEITINGATVLVDLENGLLNSSPLVFSTPVGFSGAGITDLNFSPTSFLDNDIEVRNGITSINRNTAGSITLGGDISGAGGIWLSALNTSFTLTGNNTYTGPTILGTQAPLRITDDNDLGNGGDLVWVGGTVVLDGNWNTNRNHYVNANSNAIDTNGFQATFNGGMFGGASNFATFTKLGSGTLVLAGQGDMRANLAITQGAVRLRNSYALGAPSGGGTLGGGTATVSNGAQLQIDNNISVDNFININGTGIGGTGAILNFGGNNDLTNTITLSGNSSIGANPGSRLRIAAPIQGGFAVTKVGGGVVDFGEASTYTGGTTISTGTLLVNNVRDSATGTGAVQLTTGATLGGAGFITGPVTAFGGANIAPGNSVGTLTTGSVDLKVASNFLIEIDLTADRADQLIVNGSVDLNGVGGGPVGSKLVFTFVSGTVPSAPSQTFVLINNDAADAVVGTFSNIADDTPVLHGLLQYVVDYNSNDIGFGTDGNDVTVTFTVVPEPGSFAGFAALLFNYARRRRTAVENASARGNNIDFPYSR